MDQVEEAPQAPEAPVADEPSIAPDPSPSPKARFPIWARQFLEIFGVTGLAIAQPLWSLLGDNPTYFVAHGARPRDIVLLVIAVTLVPVFALYVPVQIARLVSSKAGTIAAGVAVALMLSLLVIGAVNSFDDAGALVFLACLALATAGLSMLYVRARPFRLFLLYLSPAPIVLAVLFLFASPVQTLVFEGDPASLAASSDTSVVVVVFDELPLGALLTADGEVDRDRFPGFAELASVSTWYPAAQASSAWTNFAVPAILAGQQSDSSTPPVAGAYPRSLFTMLGSSHEMRVNERITSICPGNLCGENSELSDADARGSLTRDTAIVALHQHLPDDLADRWLPSISNSWANFGEQSPDIGPLDQDVPALEEWAETRETLEFEPRAFSSFVDSISSDAPPTVWYQHEMLPHMPYQLLPDGRPYGGFHPGSMTDWKYWSEDPMASINAQQRLLLQVQYIDSEIASLLDRLNSENMLDDTMIVVAADHGITFEPGQHFRASRASDGTSGTSQARADVFSVPLFIKYPNQTEGVVDERQAGTVDVVPTVADALGIVLPDDWTFAGRSLKADAAPRPTPSADERRRSPLVASLDRWFGTGGGEHDVYAVGPYGDLVGERAPSDDVAPLPDASAEHIDVADYEGRGKVGLGTDVPALYVAEIDGVSTGSWIAVAVDGRIAGLGPVFDDRDGRRVVEAMLDPSLLNDGSPNPQPYLVSSTGRLAPIPTE